MRGDVTQKEQKKKKSSKHNVTQCNLHVSCSFILNNVTVT